MKAYERETQIYYVNGNTCAEVCTANIALKQKLDAWCDQYAGAFCFTSDGEVSKYCIPKSWIKIRPPRAMSDEQREAAAERMRALAAKRMCYKR